MLLGSEYSPQIPHALQRYSIGSSWSCQECCWWSWSHGPAWVFMDEVPWEACDLVTCRGPLADPDRMGKPAISN